MTGKLVAVIALMILLMIGGNQNAIGHLNANMEHSSCKRKRVKEPKLLSPFIQHGDINRSIAISYGIPTGIKADGTVYLFILIIYIIDWVLCLLLIAAVLIAGLVFDYLMWWAFIIAIGYSVFIGILSVYYWRKSIKGEKARDNWNFKI